MGEQQIFVSTPTPHVVWAQACAHHRGRLHAGHANGEVEQLAGHVGSSQLLQLQAVLATLSQQRQ